MTSLREALGLPRTGTEAPAGDAELLDALAVRAAAGDRLAFERIYSLLVDELYAYVRGQCHDDTAAEDVISNVFLKAWRSARRYRAGSDQFRHWIFAIARNELRDHWRANRRTLELHDYDVTDETSANGLGDPADARRLVHRALAALTEEQRQVVVLRYFDNRTHEEIAAILGKREGAVRALLLRALRRMRKVMSDVAP